MAGRSDIPTGSVSRRADLLPVAGVGGLSLATGGLYLWALYLVEGVEPDLLAPVGAYVAWVALNLVSAGLLWWHRQRPLLVFAGVFVLYVAGSVLIGNAGLGGVALPLWFAVYAVASYTRARVGLSVVAAAWAASVLLQFALVAAAGVGLSAPETALTAMSSGFFFAACCAIGLGMRLQRRHAQDAAERAALVEARAAAERAEAVARERNRMARELHDLAAHELMDVLLSVRAALLTSTEPVLEEIEQKTARALRDVRSVVGALREGSAALEGSAEPAVAEPLADAAHRLVETISGERGMNVRARIAVDAQPDAIVAATTLSVLAESLVNAASHAPGQPVAVELDSGPETVRLDVGNPAPPAPTAERRTHGTGYGLLGAAERVRMLAGQFRAGPCGQENWTVTLTLPTVVAEADR